MQESALSLALAKAVAAAAWADGNVAPEERDCLMDLLYQLPGLSLKDWRTVQRLLDRPMSPAVRTRYLHQLVELIQSDNAKFVALYALERMVQADGAITFEERDLIKRFIQQVGAFPVEALGILLRLLENPMRRRDRAANRTERELASVDEVVNGRVEDWIDGEFGLETRTREELRLLCLAGILLARVIHADDRIDERELAAAIDFLMNHWGLEREQAEFVMIVSLSDAYNHLDALRVSRWLFEETSLNNRRRFLELLFEVATIDGHLDGREIDEIMHICANLRLDHLDFQRFYERARKKAG